MVHLRKGLAVLLCILMVLSDKSMAFAKVVQETPEQNRTIILNAGNGETDSLSVTLVDGKLPELPEATRTGWTFVGWYTAEVTENFWGDQDDESFSALLQKCKGNEEEAREKDFSWIIESDGSLVETGQELPANVSTLYAMYKPTNNITIRWHYNGWKKNTGVFLTHRNKEYDSPVVLADLESFLAWEEHKFTGWYTKEGLEWKFSTAVTDRDDGKVYYISDDVVTGNLDLYAHWEGRTDPDSLRLNYANTLVEPGEDTSITVSYSPVSADAPELEWTVNDDSNLVAVKKVADNGLKITLSIDENANVIERNKSVTVTAKSPTNPNLKAEASITIGHSWKLAGYEDSSCDKEGVKHYQCTKHTNVKKDVIIKPDGHRFVKSDRITKEPTCVEEGSYTDIYTCIVCNATEQVVTEIPATGQHDFYEFETLNLGKINHYQSCKVCGKTDFLYTEEQEPDDCVIVPDITDDTDDDVPKEPDNTLKDDTDADDVTADDTVADDSAADDTITDDVTSGSTEPVVDKDCDTSYNDNTNEDAATTEIAKADNIITASDMSKSYSKKAQSFSIKATGLGSTELTYSSNNKSVTVDNSGKVTIKAKFIGKATITIKSASTAEYNSASKEITVTVNPPKPTLSSVKNTKGKKMLVKWKKNAAVTGYQIQYSTDKKFQSGVRTFATAKNSTVSKTLKSLKKGATYNVRIRSYKTISGTKYYSEWSNIKKVTIGK